MNEFKGKAQETIRALQAKVKELTVTNEKQKKDSDTQIEALKTEKQKLEKDKEKEAQKSLQQLQTEKTSLEEQVATLNENLEMVRKQKSENEKREKE